jgi:uncharacterized protein (TIGR02266 family)
MTQQAAQMPRTGPPPLPATYTSAASGVRELSQLLPPGATPSLRRVWVRPEPGEGEPLDSPLAESELGSEFVQDSHFVAGLSQDLSKAAFFVATYQMLPIGTEVRVGLELPNGHAIEARGLVHWVEEHESAGHRPGIGVLFTEIDSGAIAAIAEYCRLRPPLYFDL